MHLPAKNGLCSVAPGGRSGGPTVACEMVWLNKSWQMQGLERQGFQEIGAGSVRAEHPRVAVIAHIFYEYLWPEICESLANIPTAFDLYVNIVHGDDSEGLRRRIQARHPSARFSVSANRGYDIGGLFASLKLIDLERYDLICKVHTKRAAHLMYGEQWRRSMLQSLLGSPETVRRIWDRFSGDATLGMVGDARYRFGAELICHNAPQYSRLCKALGIEPDIDNLSFFGGTMFWCRPAIMARLRDLGLEVEDFERPPAKGENDLRDGQMAHAIERLLGRICTAEGFSLGTANRLDFFTSCDRGSAAQARWLAEAINRYEGDADCIVLEGGDRPVPQLLLEQLEAGVDFAVYLAPGSQCFADPRRIVNALADCNVIVIDDHYAASQRPTLVAVRACAETLAYLRRSRAGFAPLAIPGVRFLKPEQIGFGHSAASLPTTREITIDDHGRLFFDGGPCLLFRWPEDESGAHHEVLMAGRHTRGLRFLLKAFQRRATALGVGASTPRRPLRQLPTRLRQRFRDVHEDLGLGLKLLRREGGRQFLVRSYWYLRGRQLPHELKQDADTAR